MTLFVDNREPWPHPWVCYFPREARLVRNALEAGSMAVAALPEGAVVRRLTVADFLDAVGRGREEFERELARARHLGAYALVVEGTLEDVILKARGVRQPAVMATVATWTRRAAPVLFAGGVRGAADLAYRFLSGQVREVDRAARAIARTERAATVAAKATSTT